MSDHHINKIASGMDRLPLSRESVPATSVPGTSFAIPLPSKGISVLSGAQKLVKMATAA